MATDRREQDMQHYYPQVPARRMALGFIDLGLSAPVEADLAAIADAGEDPGVPEDPWLWQCPECYNDVDPTWAECPGCGFDAADFQDPTM